MPHSAHLRPRHPLPPSRRCPTRRLRRSLRPPQPKSLSKQICGGHPRPALEPFSRPPAGPHLPSPRRRPRLHQQPPTPHPPRYREAGKLRQRRPRQRRCAFTTRHRRHASPRPQPPASAERRTTAARLVSHSKFILAIVAKTLRLSPHPRGTACRARYRHGNKSSTCSATASRAGSYPIHFFNAFAIAPSASGAITAYPAVFGCSPSTLKSRFKNPVSSTIAEK